MDKSDEIVFAPSIDWAKRKAKLLRKRIGPDSITHTAALDLLARMYGFRNWSDYVHFKTSDQVFETGWDTELLEKTLDERRYLQSTTLMTELGLTEAEALRVLADVGVSGKAANSKTNAAESAPTSEKSFTPVSLVKRHNTALTMLRYYKPLDADVMQGLEATAADWSKAQMLERVSEPEKVAPSNPFAQQGRKLL
ncbi:glyoxalase superfamily protein [Burkholderia vietnamiensis]|uniref:glyoxalase superfamily protein n=1 Tax=Burkholderia vietnamiensis TaxID=60552 RepID=UPI00264EFAD5|nr:glyoxalase superfamily protein [Burkholderia vietnamiensis]MDN8037056.1 glyoxalase superfamily protein [Burkholderia vietnamiensis]